MVWDAFEQLAAARGGNGYSLNPIGWQDMLAWQQVTGAQLTPWEAECIVCMDCAARAVTDKKG